MVIWDCLAFFAQSQLLKFLFHYKFITTKLSFMILVFFSLYFYLPTDKGANYLGHNFQIYTVDS